MITTKKCTLLLSYTSLIKMCDFDNKDYKKMYSQCVKSVHF